jgi:hypothetical protein
MKSCCVAIVLVLAGILSAMCLFPSPSSAYCVYNHTNTNLIVCGENCSKCYDGWIKSGHHSCCPGNHKGCGGQTYITITPYKPDITSDHKWYAPIQVTNHGWVSFFGKCEGSIHSKDYCDNLTVKVHNNDGHVIYDGALYRYEGHWNKCRDD